ncbi:DnaB-like helicase N-terminal domain-containing protein, partial [Streptomyces sp. NPDC057757]|uniref:DnaB-like helicase N-terminal domain-containing protein n=1 Tax=Streptomyces sp. NPDC057757 TaxID=3346241 RepID=UPI0036BF4409
MSNVRHMPRDQADDDGLNRTPPGDPAAERALLAQCIHRASEYTEAAELITTSDFTQPAHQLLWDVIGHQLAEHKPTDPVSLRAAIERLGQLRTLGGDDFLWQIAREAGGGSAQAYAEILREKTRLRGIEELAIRLRSGVLNGGIPDDLDTEIAGYLQQRTTSTTANPYASRLMPGGSFILDRPDAVPTLWGDGDSVLWAEGEALLIAGPSGVGKTTVAQQVILNAIGVHHGGVLGMPVRRFKRILYLASDRPQQAARSMARMVRLEDRELLDEHLVFWPGPPPADFIKDPGILLRLCEAAGADGVSLDSL